MGSSNCSKCFERKESELSLRNNKILKSIRIERIDVRIEKKKIIIDEQSDSVLKYETPHFKY